MQIGEDQIEWTRSCGEDSNNVLLTGVRPCRGPQYLRLMGMARSSLDQVQEWQSYPLVEEY